MYKLANMPDGKQYIIRLSDGAFIPQDPNNKDYQTYLIWVNAGNTPEAT